MHFDLHTVLVVEDDDAIREALRDLLGDEGYEVVAAIHGQEALDQLRGGLRPCLIVLDLMMPVMDGWAFRAAQEQDPALAAIPVLVISADGGVREKAAKLRATEYASKPIEFDSLLAKVSKHCPRACIDGAAS